MGAVIAKLGEQMLASDGEEYEAEKELATIDDPRVIPLFGRVGDAKVDIKVTALRALARFNSAEAFEYLRAAMATNELKDIRDNAAWVLSQSAYPGARAFLLEQRHDADNDVRSIIVGMLEHFATAEELPILQEMSGDQNEVARNEARYYIILGISLSAMLAFVLFRSVGPGSPK